MFILSPWMTLAIIVSGIISDFVMILPIWKNVKAVMAMGVYNGMSFLTSFYIGNYITSNSLYSILNFQGLLIVLVLTVITGILGGYAGLKLDKIYLKLKDYKK